MTPMPADFRHAQLDRVELGPRREATFFLRPLVWNGPNGKLGDELGIRLGGIENFEEVQSFVTQLSTHPTELARFDYGKLTKPHSIQIELLLERTDAVIFIKCRNVQCLNQKN